MEQFTINEKKEYRQRTLAELKTLKRENKKKLANIKEWYYDRGISRRLELIRMLHKIFGVGGGNFNTYYDFGIDICFRRFGK